MRVFWLDVEVIPIPVSSEKPVWWLKNVWPDSPQKIPKTNVLIQNEAEFIINEDFVEPSQGKDVLLSQDSKDKLF